MFFDLKSVVQFVAPILIDFKLKKLRCIFFVKNQFKSVSKLCWPNTQQKTGTAIWYLKCASELIKSNYLFSISEEFHVCFSWMTIAFASWCKLFPALRIVLVQKVLHAKPQPQKLALQHYTRKPTRNTMEIAQMFESEKKPTDACKSKICTRWCLPISSTEKYKI